MSPPPASAATSPSDDNRTARDILEGFGKEIQQKARTEAQRRSKGHLKGKLSESTYRNHKSGTEKPLEPCQLDHRYHTNVTSGFEKDNPCKNRPNVRFSDVIGGQCTDGKIKGNNTDSGGACAPLRRIFLCDQHLSHMDESKINNTNNLLLEVSLAAKYEGDSIIENYIKRHSNREGICIALARSFADIGDIIRGKDLFIGYNQKDRNEKEQLQNKLKYIFKNIYDDLKDSKAKEDYKDDNGGNFYKLREDWWNENRDQVWKAITCDAEEKDIYSKNIKNGYTGFSHGRCGHGDANVQTYLDYVPQFLRWFDEWGEEFCRKKKMKLKMAKEACRDEENGKYCSLNGYDCTKIIGNEEFFSWDSKCTGCSVKCIPYDLWLKNQRKEFEKQTKKYNHEIKTYTSKENKSESNINKEYYKTFYDELNTIYKNHEHFLKLLNKGKYCKKQNSKEEDIDFTITGEKDTFYRSDYCQVCPDCGVECKDKKCTKKRIHGNCRKFKAYVRPKDVKPTTINIVHSVDKPGNITQKLKDFCKEENIENEKNYQTWECYYKDKNDNNCEMKSAKHEDQKHPNVISFDAFFHSWVKNLLIDSIKWENDLKECINNTNCTDCNDVCNKHCVCFGKWVKQKEQEWKNVKKVFKKENRNMHNYDNILNNLFDSFYFQVMYALNEEEEQEGKWNKLIENLKQIIDSSNGKVVTKDSESAIKVLFDYLKETATICKDNNTNEACPSSQTSTQNTCVNNTASTGGNKKRATVKEIAQYYKRLAHAQLEERGGRSNVKGDASKGEYARKGDPSKLKKVCKIAKVHSNRNSRHSKGPCYNKGTGTGIDTRFEIGTVWQADPTQIRKGHEDVLMPPRRRHMCISNLENLKTMSVGLTGANASHSLLGDVILSAKFEAQRIIQMYKERNKIHNEDVLNDPKHHETICRSIRYSFADIGDIIRGKDLGENGDQNKLQRNLQIIFGKIKENLPEDIRKKYKDTKIYSDLREDWWEANRAKVWESMKCEISKLKEKSVDQSKSHCGYSDHTPLDDYIPQRLRWMTEWAEWYCKAQNKYYGELVKGCQKCKGDSNGKNCYKETQQCNDCKEACDKYKGKINKWKEQWTKIEAKYTLLYSNARIHAFNGGPGYYIANVQKEDQSVYDFLYNLYVQNGGTRGPPSATHPSSSVDTRVERAATSNNTPYDNIGAYLHDTGNFDDCQKQNVFCENSGGDNYAFEDPPSLYKEACGCHTRPAKVPQEKKEENDDVCQIVKELIGNNNGRNLTRKCNAKNYNDWNCKPSDVHSDHVGACMPPRREKLCIYYFGNTAEIPKMKTQDILRDAFIKSAAGETFRSWHYYKSKNGNANNLDNKLKGGTIPEDFKRQMLYTFGDYRDFLFGTDISKDHGKGSKLKNQIDTLFPPNNKKPGTLSRQEWWKNHGPAIWKAMLCALEKAWGKTGTLTNTPIYDYKNETFDGTTKLEDFAKRPQFLRWMTEWSEHFCKKQSQEYNNLKEKCTGCKVVTCESECKTCKDQCTEYQRVITQWKGQWTQQSEKYQQLYTKAVTKGFNGTVDETERKHLEYLKELKKPNGSNNEYSTAGKYVEKEGYIEDCQEQNEFSNEGDNKYPFRDYPNDHQNKCNCKKEIPFSPPKKPEVPTVKVQQACDLVKGILNGKDGKTKIGGCELKDKNNNYTPWKCGIKSGLVIDDGVCMPPRRQKLCLHFLAHTNETPKIKTQEDLRKAFIKCAAVETFLSWQYYKSKNGNVETQLQNGTIPPEFLRSMFYTYGDYRDICLNSDISKKQGYVLKANKKIEKILPKNGGETNYTKCKEFWDNNGKDIWEGMVCGLSHALNGNDKETKRQNLTNNTDYEYETVKFTQPSGPNLKTFSSRPQFLRWMIEWGEDFCKERKKEMAKLVKACPADTCNGDNGKKEACKKSCEDYKKWITKWQEHYDKQKIKFKTVKKNDSDASKSDHAYEYLDKQLQKFCDQNGTTKGDCDYNCMKEPSKQPNTKSSVGSNDSMPASLDDEPEEVQGRCKCLDPPPKRTEGSPKKEEMDEVCKEVKKLLQANKGNTKSHGCETKKYNGWSCNLGSMNKEIEGTCVPPRRQKLCISDLQTSSYETKERLKNSFINCVAMETHFAWENYKCKNNGSKEKLQKGQIPENFLRIMYYTYADYRDILFGKNIMKSNANTNEVINNINEFFKCTKDNEEEVKKEREDWWEANRKQIWEAMLCALTHEVNENLKEKIKESGRYSDDIEEFAKRPTFLRWYIEWSDEFCEQRQEKEKKVSDACSTDYEGCDKSNTKGNGNGDCAKACEGYTKYITCKKEQYESQKKTFEAEKSGKEPEYKGYSNTQSSDYLKENCLFGSCDCLEKVKDNSDYWENPHTTYENPDLQKRCICPPSPCEIVDGILGTEDGTSYSDGCKWKYGTMPRREWLCNSSGGKEGDTTVCIPPRRQRLYVKNIEDLRDTSLSGLRTAFIEAAAVETFFSWHEYKKEKERKDIETKGRDLVVYTSPVPKELDKDLESGTIPDDFLRQMFYTFGDYRDICLGNDLVKSDVTKNISEKVGTIFSSDKKTISKDWWDENAEAIWDGMICALSYKTENRIKDDTVYKNLIGEDSNINTKYQYNNMKKDLENVAKTPQFLRWFEEWAEEFCRKKTNKLKKLKEECRGKYKGHKYCSSDGYDCELINSEKNENFADLDCPGCQEECRKYNEWIINKRNEFDKQKNNYDKENEKLNNSYNNENDQTFHNYLKTKGYLSAQEFWKSLKDGKPCEDNKNEINKIDFNYPNETFGPSEYCKMCPLYGVTRKSNGEYKDNSEHEWKRKNDLHNINKEKNIIPSYIDIEVNGRMGHNVDIEMNDFVNNSALFKGTEKLNWKCQYINEIDQCNVNNMTSTSFEQTITFKVLFQRWLRYFVQDYNKLKEKIKPCIKNEDEKSTKCIKGCNKKCEYVGKWLEIKGNEWENIKNHYNKNQSLYIYSIPHWVKGFFEQRPFIDDVKEAKKVFDKQMKDDDIWGCTGSNLIDGVKKKCEKGDFITNLISELKNKVTSCQNLPEPKTQCVNIELPDTLEKNVEGEIGAGPKFCDNIISKIPEAPPDEVPEVSQDQVGQTHPNASEDGEEKDKGDEEEEEEEEEEEDEEEDYNESDSDIYDDDSDSETEEEGEDEAVPNSLSPSESRPKRLPRESPSPELKKAMLSSTIMWSVGISFAAITYFLLKKKPHSPVDLLRVLDIHKGDYGMPTLKSSNRYIPYGTDKYKGKSYIYIEGDSGTDSGYTDHYSDITSSSESEYEEFDINDIYVPGSPKYKTLIEVVLEPSKRDTQNDIQSGDTIPNSDNTIPNSDNTIPNSDNTPSNSDNTPPTSDTPPPITDDEWNQLKDDFISQYLQSEQNDVPNDYTSGNVPTNTNNTTMSRHNVDNNTHPTPSRHTVDQKPFIMSIHDRNLLSGEEYSYDMINNIGNNDLYSGIDTINGNNDLYSGFDSTSRNRGSYSDKNDPYSDKNGPTSGKHGSYSGNNDLYSGQNNLYSDIDTINDNGGPYSDKRDSYSDNRGSYSDNRDSYSGIDLINDALSSNKHIDIYDEVLKRKENELFGTNYKKNTSNNSVAKLTNSDPIMNQLDLFHKWLDRHRDMCEKWDTNNKKEELLDKLKEKWENETLTSGNRPNDNKTLNTDVSIEIHMDNPKPINKFSNMDTNVDTPTMDDMEDDIYYDVNYDDNQPSVDDIPMDHNKVDVPKKVHVEMKILNNTSNGSLEQQFPISDVWNI
ncbi:erythrocyte membrane protein 1, PfEMP1, putative [Plasmodium reichenowi]|uniref:Erythrocyte membrane protein 1, PfEMP1, putative n=1 Tax=Plasmodium reichenowi TaxID=5854 RepID=A0A2P9DMX5_PLARE|nr:erythrocyte membrane protein 1, PfEMP1, putative [Plasmodium reichenowi]